MHHLHVKLLGNTNFTDYINLLSDLSRKLSRQYGKYSNGCSHTLSISVSHLQLSQESTIDYVLVLQKVKLQRDSDQTANLMTYHYSLMLWPQIAKRFWTRIFPQCNYLRLWEAGLLRENGKKVLCIVIGYQEQFMLLWNKLRCFFEINMQLLKRRLTAKLRSNEVLNVRWPVYINNWSLF